MVQKLAKFSILKWIPTIVCTITISYLSFSSLQELKIPTFSSADKLAHIIMYFVLSYCVWIGSSNSLVLFKKMLVLVLIFAAATELIQNYIVINRTGDYLDFVANTMGIIIAFVWKRKSF